MQQKATKKLSRHIICNNELNIGNLYYKIVWHITINISVRTYLSKSCKTEIFADIVIREIAESSHPHICSDKNSNSIVDFSCSKIVIHQKQHLQEDLITWFHFHSIKKIRRGVDNIKIMKLEKEKKECAHWKDSYLWSIQAYIPNSAMLLS